MNCVYPKTIDVLIKTSRKGDYEAILAIRFGRERWRFWRDESGTAIYPAFFADEDVDLESIKDKFKDSDYCTFSFKKGAKFEDIFT